MLGKNENYDLWTMAALLRTSLPDVNRVGAMNKKIPISDHGQIIDVLGGNSVVAAHFGVTDAAVCLWRLRGIPFPRRAAIKRMLEGEGFCVPHDFHESRGGRRHVR
jgi:hypothetical protein